MRDFRIPIEEIIGIVFWSVSLWWGVHTGCVAYHATPDIEPFSYFASPLTSVPNSGDPKIIFLFGPLFVATAFALISLSIPTGWLDARFGERGTNQRVARLFVVGIGTLAMAVVVADHGAEAIAAAHRIGWHGVSAPSTVVDTACAITN